MNSIKAAVLPEHFDGKKIDFYLLDEYNQMPDYSKDDINGLKMITEHRALEYEIAKCTWLMSFLYLITPIRWLMKWVFSKRYKRYCSYMKIKQGLNIG